MKKNHKSILILVTLLFCFILCLLQANHTIQNFLDYSSLFFTKLFPVSFIMFLFSSLLIRYQIIEVISTVLPIRSYKIYVFLLSLLSGFPSGAKYTKELWESKNMKIEEANHILMFSHFPNPLFVLGSVNFLLDNLNLSISILLSIGISNFILMIGKRTVQEKSSMKRIQFPSCFSKELKESVFHTINTILLIYGTSVFFYLMANLFTYAFCFSTRSYLFINGFFDLTKGIFSTSILKNTIEKSYWILGFLSFGSLSIHMQVKSILEETPISYFSFLKGRIIGTILSFIIFHFLH